MSYKNHIIKQIMIKNKKYLFKRYLPIVPDPVLENLCSVCKNVCGENVLAQERFHSAALSSFK